VVEFQTTSRTESGLSAYLLKRAKSNPWHVGDTNVQVDNASLAFPSSTGGANVFLDRMHIGESDLEMMLQALVDQNFAFILSRPRAMVTVASPVPTVIETTANIPYENTVVAGASTTQITSFRPTGVKLTVTCPQVVDDDGDPSTTEDTFVQLVIDVTVAEEGSRIVVALDDSVSVSGGNSVFGTTSNAISVPTFVSRAVTTTVWVRHGQVLMLGGLYRNTKTKNVRTLPWLTQGEDLAVGLAERAVPQMAGKVDAPLTSVLGNKSSIRQRRELVFFVKAELWKPSFTVANDLILDEDTGEKDGSAADAQKEKKSLKNVIQDITEIPQGVAQGITQTISNENTKDGVENKLGGGAE
jgi:Flp pilus assembly secretin CpaC